MSSCETEYVVAATAAMQAVWLSRLIADIQGTEAKSVKLLVDNKSAIALSKNPVHHDRNKHSILHHLRRSRIHMKPKGSTAAVFG